jgi:hypothetical protein
VIDSVPGAWSGAKSTLKVRGLNEAGVELDNVSLVR